MPELLLHHKLSMYLTRMEETILIGLEVFKTPASLDLSLGYISQVTLVFPQNMSIIAMTTNPSGS